MLFLQKNAKYRASGAPPPHPRASGGWGFLPQTPKHSPQLRISGYAPVFDEESKRALL